MSDTLAGRPSLAADTGIEPRAFDVRLVPAREAVHVQPVGELDLAAVPQLREPIDELMAAGFTELVLDLRGVSFIDVAGLGLLIELAARARREGWKLAMIQGGDQVRRICELAGVLDRLPFRQPATPARRRYFR